MIIGGLEKFSLIDYPGELSAVIFTQGCNFKCPFCHNPMLVDASLEAGKKENKLRFSEEREGHPFVKKGDLFDFLKSRIDKLDGVVVTGGEPTIHKDLPQFLSEIKEMGFKIKLDSNGSNPEVLDFLIKQGMVDFLAMDIKGDPDKYKEAVGVDLDFSVIRKSVKIIMSSSILYEFRTTLVPDLVGEKEIKKIGTEIKGADKWCLQKFISHTPLVNQDFRKKRSLPEEEVENLKKIASGYVSNLELR